MTMMVATSIARQESGERKQRGRPGLVFEDFATDPTMDARHGTHHFAKQPEWALITSILEDAIRLIANYRRHYSHWQDVHLSTREEILTAIAWVFEPGDGWFLDFDNVMDILGLEPKRMQQRIRGLLGAHENTIRDRHRREVLAAPDPRRRCGGRKPSHGAMRSRD